MISAASRLCAFVLFAVAALPLAPQRASGAVGAPPSALAAMPASNEAAQLVRVRKDRRAARRAGLRRGRGAPTRRARGSGNPVYSNIRPNATLPLSIMVPEPGVRQPPPPAVRVAPARVLPPVAVGQRPTIVPQAVTPNPETFNDRVVRCTHSAGVNGVSPGQQGLYVSSCAN